MNVAICSDSHDNLVNIKKFLSWCNRHKIESIIHCGDWCAPSVLELYRKRFKGKLYGVYGNVHADDETMKKFAKRHKITIKEDELAIKIESIKILVTHYPDKAKKIAEEGKFDLVFYGHSHVPWMKKVENTYIANPGTLAGMFQKASFAVYDTKTRKLDLKILELI
ncbi:YfcE family phosphodiesterase [Candidatus Falkowbacteria bacterium]|jgi:uncharacterized protein|nr:YfcE family phosphodiesterase [Candidatus Falkowbacteria bacterium]MBT7007785.1 YfcE family phosphodiesterase [Candidatus Falkowbacteria bacterium]